MGAGSQCLAGFDAVVLGSTIGVEDRVDCRLSDLLHLSLPMNIARTSVLSLLPVVMTLACATDPQQGEPPTSTAAGTTDDADASTGNTAPTTITATATATITATAGSTESTGSSSGESATTGDTESSTQGDTTGAAGTSIYDVQMGIVAAGEDVTIAGVIVTGVFGASGIFVQDPAGGEYSGLYVDGGLTDVSALSIGDEVDISGVVTEELFPSIAGLTTLDTIAGSITATGATGLDPVAVVVAVDTLVDPVTAEPWESVLIQIQEASPLAIVAEPGNDEFDVSAGGAVTRVDDLLYNVYDFPDVYPVFTIEASFSAMTGVLNYAQGQFKLAPRQDSDLSGYIPYDPPGLSVEDLVAGDLVITEIMADPSCGASCEWIEIYNASGVDVNLHGLVIDDVQGAGSMPATLTDYVVLGAAQYGVVSRSNEPWPFASFTPLAMWSAGPGFNNASADSAAILNASIVIDETATYSSATANVAWKFSGTPNAVANDNAANWCDASTLTENLMGMDNFGTPGTANPGC